LDHPAACAIEQIDVRRAGWIARTCRKLERAVISSRLPQLKAQLLHPQVPGVSGLVRRLASKRSVECEPELSREQVPDLERSSKAATALDRAECRPGDTDPTCEPFLCQLPATTGGAELAPALDGRLPGFKRSRQQRVLATA